MSSIEKKLKKWVRWLPWLIVAAILLYAASASIADKQFQWLQPPDWSRGKLIGKTALREAAVLAVDPQDNVYMLLFPGSGTRQDAALVSLDAHGNERWEQLLATDLATPTSPKLLWHEEQLIAFWLLDETVHRATIAANGSVLTPSEPLTFEVPVASFETAVSADGLALWVGGTQTEPGVYAQFDDEPAQLIDAEGRSPLIQVDENGRLHAAWLRRLSGINNVVLYGGTSATDSWFNEPIELTQLTLGSTARLRGPWFTLENGRGYLAWSTEFLSGLSAGQSLSQFVSFALEPNAVVSSPADFEVPYRRQRDYPQEAGPIQAGNRVPLLESRGRKASPLGGQALISQQASAQESVLALRVSVEHLKQQGASQIALYYLAEGQPNGYQILTFSPSGSMHPALTQTASGDLLVSWLERSQSSGINVYFAGTPSALQTSFSRLTLQDYGIFVVETLFGMMQSVSFAPFSLLFWAGVPLVFLALTGLLRRKDQSWRHPAFLVPLITAVVIFWFAKYITLQDALWYVPFSAWIPIIPSWFALPLRILTPLAITAFAAYLAWHFSYRQHRNSILLLFGIYAGLDTILSMSIYGGILYNAL